MRGMTHMSRVTSPWGRRPHAAAGVLLALGLLLTGAAPAPAATYYLAPGGSNGAAGSLAAPWQTLAYALPRLAPGDTLILRGGTYYQTGIKVSVQGTAAAPITVRAMEGESPVVDGGYSAFRTPGNADWELVDAATHHYRSQQTFSGTLFGGYLAYAGRDYKLVSYEDPSHLTTSNQRYLESGAIYVGQGLSAPGDGRIHVRLEKGELQSVQGIVDPPTLDPGLASLTLFGSGDLMDVLDATRYLVIDGIDFVNGYTPFRIHGGVTQLTIRNARIRGGRYAFRIHEGASYLTFDGLLIDDAVPDWIAWQDVKTGSQPAHQMQGAGFDISGDSNHIEIANCTIQGTFDGIDANGTPHDFDVHHNTFVGTRDDAMSLSTASQDIEFHHNLLAPVYTSVGRYGQGTSPKPGSTWIHHNVVDASTPMQHGRMNPDGSWRGGTADGRFTVHAIAANHNANGFGQGDAWKIYHNTFIVNDDDEGNQGVGHTKQSYPGALHEVYNNIFIQLADLYVARRPKAVTQYYDGNLYWRPVAGAKTPMFYDCEREDGSHGHDFDDLAEFMASSFHRETGWEAHGVEGDPGLDADYRPAAGGPAAGGAVPLPAGFPGDLGESFRGALPPAGSLPAGPAPSGD